MALTAAPDVSWYADTRMVEGVVLGMASGVAIKSVT